MLVALPLLDSLRRAAPGVSVGLRQLLSAAVATMPERAWRKALATLEAREMDVAVIPSGAAGRPGHAPPARVEEQNAEPHRPGPRGDVVMAPCAG